MSPCPPGGVSVATLRGESPQEGGEAQPETLAGVTFYLSRFSRGHEDKGEGTDGLSKVPAGRLDSRAPGSSRTAWAVTSASGTARRGCQPRATLEGGGEFDLWEVAVRYNLGGFSQLGLRPRECAGHLPLHRCLPDCMPTPGRPTP